MNIVETNELVKRYGKHVVINKVSMHIPEKSIYGFVGENGSGKTTIMRLLTGLAEPSGGSFSLFGVNNKSRDIYKVRTNISAIVETASLVPSMTAKDNMIYYEKYLGIKLSQDERKELLKKVHLDDVGNKKVKNYSLGMRQRLAIAISLINKPKLMLLDEPMNGLDPEGIAELRNLIIELNQSEGISVLISSHILSELEKVASHYGFILKGNLLEEITADELQEKCRKSLAIYVDNLEAAKDALQKANISEFEAYPNGEIKIFEEVKIADAVKLIDKAGVTITAIHSTEGSVEDYYLELIKEAR